MLALFNRTYAVSVFFAFGRALLDFFGVLFSALRAENSTQMIVTYHAAAGKIGFKCGSPRKSCYLQATRADLAVPSTHP
jgi:hypothetical protein